MPGVESIANRSNFLETGSCAYGPLFLEMESFDVVRRIGRGNYGTAWLVRRKSSSDPSRSSRQSEHLVIKKIPLLSLKPSEVQSAHQEVRLLIALQHPNIVKTMESFVQDETLHIAMQYCEGGDLAERIKATKKAKESFSKRQILEWLVQIVMAVGHIHARLILHRDLKTSNVFLARNNVIKLGDFGIAKVLEYSLEEANTVIGTPYYMSPEVCSNRPYSFKSDIVSASIMRCAYLYSTL